MFIANEDKTLIAETLQNLVAIGSATLDRIEAIEKTHEIDLGLTNEEVRVAAEVYLSLVKSMSNLKKDIVTRFDELYRYIDVSRFEHEDGSYELIDNGMLVLEQMFKLPNDRIVDEELESPKSRPRKKKKKGKK